MAQPGDDISFAFNGGSAVTEDISNVDEINIKSITGAGGAGAGDTTSEEGSGGAGGLIRDARVDVSANSSLDVFVGGGGAQPAGGAGRSDGGDGGDESGGPTGGGGGGSTELLLDGSFLAAADAGGGGATLGSSDSDGVGGGGGARGGDGGTFNVIDGQNAGGSGFGGDGGDGGDSADDGANGGQELSGSVVTLSRTEETSGGGNGGDGSVRLLFDIPFKPVNLSASEDLDTVGPTVDLAWDNDNRQRFNRVYRSTVSSPTFPEDFSEVGTAAEGTTTFRDSPPDFETEFRYRVTSESGGESEPSDPVTITTSAEGDLQVTITGTNSPVTVGDTLDLDVKIENVGGYRAEETIDADLEPQ